MVIGRRFRRAVSCALLALAVAPVAHAQDRVSVPIKHAEDISVRAIHFAAAQQSKDALVLVIYGTNESMKKTALAAAAQTRAAGYPVRGVIIGPERDDARFVVEFYADAQLASTFLNPTPGDTDTISSEVKRTYEMIVRPRLTSK